jgi:hypothetical protein
MGVTMTHDEDQNLSGPDEQAAPLKPASPWTDLKDARSAAETSVAEGIHTVKKVNDFAVHSTSRVLGPLATLALKGIGKAYGFVTGKKKK